jgi:hypothetical protein
VNVKKPLRLLIIGILVITSALIALKVLSEPAMLAVQSSTKLRNVDLADFRWSGQNEGETVLVKDPPESLMYTPPFKRFSLCRGIDEAAKRLGGAIPEVPTILPEGIGFADVYVGPDVMISYSYHGAENFRTDNITIEISRAPSRIPTVEERRLSLLPTEELVLAGDKWALITGRAFGCNGQLIVSATFFHGNLTYAIGAEPQLTKQDVISMIESMRIPG